MSVSPAVLDEAIRSYIATRRGASRPPAFDNAILDIRTKGTMDERAYSAAVQAVDKQCRRLFAFIRHGNPTKRLSKADKEACRPGVTRGTNHVRFDFSQLLGRLRDFAANWAKPPKQGDMFKQVVDLLRDRTTPLDQVNTRLLLTSIVYATALNVRFLGALTIAGTVMLGLQKENNSHQLALLKQNQMQAVGASLSKSDQTAVAAAVQADVMHVTHAVADLADGDPVFRFVSVESERFRPALFDVLAKSGGGTINGVEFHPDGAAEVAKQGRQNVRRGIGPWTTTTTS